MVFVVSSLLLLRTIFRIVPPPTLRLIIRVLQCMSLFSLVTWWSSFRITVCSPLAFMRGPRLHKTPLGVFVLIKSRRTLVTTGLPMCAANPLLEKAFVLFLLNRMPDVGPNLFAR